MYKRLSLIRDWVGALADLLYPVTCEGCGKRMDDPQELFCIPCQRIQPPTDLHLFRENEFTRHFTGRLNVFSAAALYYYVPGGLACHLVEKIKYGNRPDLATSLGRYYGDLLKGNEHFDPVGLVTCVPLHPSKKIRRGYNQSECFGEGLATALGKPFDPLVLRRHKAMASLIAMDRHQRMMTLQETYALSEPRKVPGRHVLLVDDVMTTGATMEACGRLILEAGASGLSLLTLAVGR